MAEDGPASLAWLSTRVPMWALLLASLGAGATSVAGGSWRWLENNEPRLQSLNGRVSALEQQNASLLLVNEHQFNELKSQALAGLAEVRVELTRKVDTSTRLEMLASLTDRISQIERHIEMQDVRINALVERSSIRPKGGGL